MQYISNRLYLSIVFLFLFTSLLPAKTVLPNEAEMIAGTFLRHASKRALQNVSMVDYKNKLTRSGGTPEYYIFNGDQDGYVIVSGNTKTDPILAYSYSGAFDADNLPPNLENWLEQLSIYISKLEESDIDDGAYSKSWNNLQMQVSELQPEVLYETALWGQGDPFNRKCPEINGKRTIVGCTGTALAIIMRYYKYPDKGTGSTEAYSYTDETGYTRTMSSVSYEVNLNWSNMPLNYTGTWTTGQMNQVSQLCYLCALSCHSQFGAGSTGGVTRYGHMAAIEHFDYDEGGYFVSAGLYSGKEWKNKLKENLSSIGPIYYSAFSEGKSSGHAFVLDGYDADSRFHINWGWNGYNNGYFYFPEFLDFTTSHAASFGLQPDKGGSPYYLMVLDDEMGCKGIILSTDEEIEENKPFYINCGFLYNGSLSTFSGVIAAAVIDRAGDRKVNISSDYAISNLRPNYGYSSYSIKCELKDPPEVGDRVTLFYKEFGGQEWKRVLIKNKAKGEIPLYDSVAIDESTTIKFNPLENRLVLLCKEGVSYTLSLNDVQYHQGKTSEGVPVVIDTKVLPSGRYVLSLTKKHEDKEVVLNIAGGL